MDDVTHEVVNENSPTITAVEKPKKVKDPKRVEAGKKLGAISNAAKEKKMRKRLTDEQKSDSVEPKKLIVYTSLFAALFFLGIQYFTTPSPKKPKPVIITSTPATQRQSKLESLD